MTMTVKRTEVSKPVTDLSNIEEFLKWEEASRDTIDVKRCYIDLAGDLVTGILLSQIIYWYLPSKRGESRLRIKRRDGKHWMAKGRRDWWDECRVTPKQFDRSIGILRAKGLVETRLWKFRGSPTLHVCLNMPALVEGVKWFLPKGENRYLPKVKNGIDQTVKTSNIDYLTEITDIEHFEKEEEDGEDNHLPPEPDILTFFQEYLKIDRINPAIEGELRDLAKNFPLDRVRAAIIAAALHEVGSPLPYIRAVLENERDRKEKGQPGQSEDESRKNVLGSADNVRLTDNEVLDLVKRFSKGGAEARIEGLSLFKGSSGREYKCDYWTILSWDKRDEAWDPEPPDSWRISQKWLDERASVAPAPAPETPPPVRDGKCGCFVIGGYTPTTSSRPFRSLVLGLPASDGLKHVGNVGVGFKLNSLPELYNKLQAIRSGESPFEPGTDMTALLKHGLGGCYWVKPVLVAEVKYGVVTRLGKLYEPMFRRLRPDLTAEDARVGYEEGAQEPGK